MMLVYERPHILSNRQFQDDEATGIYVEDYVRAIQGLFTG